ncbi:putative MFS family arabinose efflux permease [Thioalkalivibrio sp. ALE21]|uniref:MFS transporter n=1 Tax=Thioalkalivibrio sp. ALE21 TaxID=1158175 RepID=UPI000D8D696F|nr:MFS transporter [Thioalkalivibrio sp. ALE21]PYG02992.1 putative MFS family arabinose efflux permease [Thioalkalivibrio sp. ALE21]
MNARELRATTGLAAIYGVRMAGLFLILPVFMLHADDIPGATPLLAGLALGIYGLTQAALQIPFGLLSDRLGRKPLIAAGLGLFVLGSLVAGFAEDIHGIILGRALQGAGAVAAVVLALTADLVTEERRTRALAVIGLTIGLTFTVSMALGPVLDRGIGLSGIFLVAAGLGVLALVILLVWVPSPGRLRQHPDMVPQWSALPRVLADPDLARMNAGIFILHLVLAANFLVLPTFLVDGAGLAPADHWAFYLPVLLTGFALMLPGVILGERRRRMHGVLLVAIGLLVVVQAALGLVFHLGGDVWVLALLMVGFFAAFNLLEAGLPAMVSRAAPLAHKGTAMGGFATAQFLGIFAGGALGGALLGLAGPVAVLLASVPALVTWLLLARGRTPEHLVTRTLAVPAVWEGYPVRLLDELRACPGVAEVVLSPDAGSVYLRLRPELQEEGALQACLERGPAR